MLCAALTFICFKYAKLEIIYIGFFITGGVSAVDLTSVKARIQWTDGASNGRSITNYTIQGQTSWTPKWVTLATNIRAKVSNL